MAKYQFLSDEWFTAVEEAAKNFSGPAPKQNDIMINVTVNATPWGDGRQLYLGVQEEKPVWGQGETDTADASITLDYDTAKEILIDGNVGAAMGAFMAGRIVVQGDMSKLMSLQSDGAPGGELVQQIRDLTE